MSHSARKAAIQLIDTSRIAKGFAVWEIDKVIDAAMADERAAARKLVELCNQIIAAYPCVNRSEGKFCEHGCMTERLTDAVEEYLAKEAGQ